MGGFAGRNSGTIENSYASAANVFVNENTRGGFVGRNTNVINNSYSTTRIWGIGNVRGFAGDNSGATIGWSYYDQDTAGVVAGSGEARPSIEMIQQSTFDPDWDFSSIWAINEGISYPYLQWQTVLLSASSEIEQGATEPFP